MTDRELLERAAKAAGIKITWSSIWRQHFDEKDMQWNPLTDDGDEARLEAARSISIEWHEIVVVAVTTDPGPMRHTVSFSEAYADHGGDKQKARRYAGVRVAAAIADSGEPGP